MKEPQIQEFKIVLTRLEIERHADPMAPPFAWSTNITTQLVSVRDKAVFMPFKITIEAKQQAPFPTLLTGKVDGVAVIVLGSKKDAQRFAEGIQPNSPKAGELAAAIINRVMPIVQLVILNMEIIPPQVPTATPPQHQKKGEGGETGVTMHI